MNHLRRISWFFFGLCFLVSCRTISTPVGESTTPTSIETIHVKNTATAEISPVPTSNSATQASPIPTSTNQLVPLPICQQVSGVKLKEMALAFSAEWDEDNEIYIIQADSSNLTQLTFNSSGDVIPAWAPDGRRLAYIVDRYTDPRLYLLNTDNMEGMVVAPEFEASVPALVWSPAGDRIAVRDSEDIYIVDLKNEKAINLTQDTNILPLDLSFSADGGMLAFSANVPSATPRSQLFVVNVNGTGLRELSFTEGDVSRPMWHPSEDKILFEGNTPSEGVGLYVMSLDGTVSKLPIVPRYGVPRPAWSPDGSMIGYIVHLSGFDSAGERLQLNSLHIATAVGDVDLVLVKPPEEPDVGLSIHEILWAPDSRHIAYTIRGEGGVDLYILDICNGTSTLVVKGIEFYSTPSWRPLP